MAALRQIIEEAKPSVLQLFGFAEAVENHLERAIRDSGQHRRGLVDDSAGAIDRLPGATSSRSCASCRRRSTTPSPMPMRRRIEVRLSACARQVTLTVTDDGGPRNAARRSARHRQHADARPARRRALQPWPAGPRGVGTVMRVVLAAADAEEAAGPAMKVIIVEDDALHRAYLAEAVREALPECATVIEAANGDDGEAAPARRRTPMS
jgi:hypothetical protein